MFTGIIESLGKIKKIERAGSNVNFTIAASLSDTLKIDQSLSHSGVCLTVIKKTKTTHTITAIDETLRRTNLGDWKIGDSVNLERAMLANGRLDGHIVQGHVDTVAECTDIKTLEGSWVFTFRFFDTEKYILVDKGSVCVNGVSLTVVNPTDDTFSVAVIPYTYANTNFKFIKTGDKVNLEFDILGKYLVRYLERMNLNVGR